MKTTSSAICEAADRLAGFVGYHHKAHRHIVRFSEDSFGMDVADDSITPTCEFVWSPADNELMTLSRERLQLLLEQNIDDRLRITEPLRVYMRRLDLPEIVVERRVKA
ncbi:MULTISPECIES: DUF2025 family protein [Pseudomonas]|jgi:hypothetical protein|uniref:PA1123-like domain-containing protein n=1 Tax=Pseudomonas syringae TaxID=317 RepID=A0A085VB06_PSESX|nr:MULTISPECIES: DUF2025 family protein [Pseudomonas]EPJ89624.1 hypothetical protein CFII64_00856 [Pseudomonas sp. CFII64]KFE52619.1 hypothetical protein IV02_09350 [Pseudomonas syringae]